MGAYNSLSLSMKCTVCNQKVDMTIQFKYGEVWQHNFKIGDTIIWGRRNSGIKGCRKVVLDGISEACPNCGRENDVLIMLENDVLTKVMPNNNEFDFSSSDGYYLILES